MWNKIINPKTGRNVSIFSKLGRAILNKYVVNTRGGASVAIGSELEYEGEIDGEKVNGSIDVGESKSMTGEYEFKKLVTDFIIKCGKRQSDYRLECTTRGCAKGDEIYTKLDYQLVSNDEFNTYFNVDKLTEHLLLIYGVKEYVLKWKVKSHTKIIFIGDLHSSLHSLIRHMEHWKANGIIDINYKVLDPYIIVCTGDIIDRGPYGIELLYLFNLFIRCNEPGRIQIIKGNHETLEMYSEHGFKDEIKYQLNKENRVKIKSLVDRLPVAIFIRRKQHRKWYMFCHGGMDKSMMPPISLHRNSEIKDFLKMSMSKRHRVLDHRPEGRGVGFLWGDFTYSIADLNERQYIVEGDEQCIINTDRGAYDLSQGIHICPSKFVQTVLDHNNIMSIISGHQDQSPFSFLYRDLKPCETTNTTYAKYGLCSSNNNQVGVYEYDMTEILCFILSSAVIKFSKRPDGGHTISYGCLDVDNHISTIHLI